MFHGAQVSHVSANTPEEIQQKSANTNIVSDLQNQQIHNGYITSGIYYLEPKWGPIFWKDLTHKMEGHNK